MYCSTTFDKISWETIHEGVQMYKSTFCPNCNRHITIPVDFLGSGHDDWDGKHSWKFDQNVTFPKTKKKVKNLEAKIKIISERNYPY